ncbi:MAG TPA: arylesterase [Terriglobia bacterium]|nr:arylesterase [Terriglobia bacterium]
MKVILQTAMFLLLTTLPGWSQAPDSRPVIVAFGDSMTAGYGVPGDMSYPAQLQRTLDERGYKYRVVNMGVTGDTTRGGLGRMSRAQGASPVIVILELGSNDRSNGISLQQTQDNLEQMITRFQKTRIEVVLAGRSIAGGEDVYRTLANKYHLTLIPSFLAGVSGNPNLTISDGTHPNADGYTIVVKTVMTSLEPLLKK